MKETFRREELRKGLLEWMCECAKRISTYPKSMCPTPLPVEFNPGTSDKILFLDIINRNMSCIYGEMNEAGLQATDFSEVALNLMKTYYYPEFGDYDIHQIS